MENGKEDLEKKNTKVISFRLPKEVCIEMDKIASKYNLSVSSVFREAMCQFFSKNEINVKSYRLNKNKRKEGLDE